MSGRAIPERLQRAYGWSGSDDHLRPAAALATASTERGIGLTRQEHDRSGCSSYGPCVPDFVGLRQDEHPQRRHGMASDRRLSYSVYSGRRAVGVRKAWSPAEAVIEYLHALGCQGDEIMRMRSDACVWRGATFTAAPVSGEPKP